MSAYQVAARKYRPQRFQEVVGQPHVTAILRKAVQSGRVAHAYLFSGPRGVGKTSVARILAKAVNCSHRSPEGEPCNACPSCLDVVSGRSLNIIEIDAASNNSVEDVRLLREQVRIPPQYGPYKVYIVDEVHMLSNAAFNALLKTLEEPPPYVLFIFATTEPQKVLPTILSRCQRFGFRRIGTADIVDHLRAVCAQEGVEADDKVLHLIARRSEGSLRDALSLLDQSISLCGAQLQYDELVQALGVVHAEYFFRATDLVRKRDVAEAFGLVDELFQHGVDPTEFLQGLAEHLRHVLVARIMGGDTRLIEASEADRARYAELARELREADLYRMLRIVSDTEQTLKGHPQPRLKLEWALVRLASLERTVELEELIARIDKLERRLTGTPRGAAPSSSDASSPLPAPEPRSTPKPSATAPDPATPEPIRPPFGPPALGAKAFPSPPDPPPPMEGNAARKIEAPATPAQPNVEALQQAWSDFVRHVRSHSVRLAALLSACRPYRITERHLEVLTPDPFHQKTLSEQRLSLRRHLEAFFGLAYGLHFILPENAETVDVHPSVVPPDPLEEFRRLQEQYPALRRLLERFGAEPIW